MTLSLSLSNEIKKKNYKLKTKKQMIPVLLFLTHVL